jgi:hypothetical protein
VDKFGAKDEWVADKIFVVMTVFSVELRGRKFFRDDRLVPFA